MRHPTSPAGPREFYDEIKARVAEIQGVRDDAEHAHALEDRLREDFLRWLIEPTTTALYTRKHIVTLATLVLSTSEIEFSRWTA